MKSILKDYLKYLSEIIFKCEKIVDRYDLKENLTLDERKNILNTVINFENLRLWGRSVLYGENSRPYYGEIDDNLDITNVREMLKVKLGLEAQIENRMELEREQVSVISRRELPRICSLTREIFKDPVSHRYANQKKILNICRNHVFEREAIANYLGNCRKKECPIMGCGFLVVKKYLKKDDEVLEQILNNMVKRESINNVENLI